MRTSIEGLNAVVTGGGTGIGKALALRLAALGANVVICGRNLKRLEEATDEIRDRSGNAHVSSRRLDVCDEKSVEALMDRMASIGGTDILVNNAGTLVNAPLAETSTDDFDRITATNVRGPFLMCKHAIPQLRRSRAATIVNICSAAAHGVYEGQSAYSASKAALLALSKVLAREEHGNGIRVHVLSPGGVATEMIGTARPDLAGVPMIEPDDLADALEYLLTHRTGAVVDEIGLHRSTKDPWPFG